MALMNRLLDRLQLEDTREMNAAIDPRAGVILKMPGKEEKSGVYAPDPAVNDTVTGVNRTLKTVYGVFNDSVDEEAQTVNNWSWMWKARRNRGKKRSYTELRYLICGGAVVTALFGTYQGLCFPDSLAWYMVALACFVSMDPLEVVERMLALPTRICLAADVMLWVSVLYTDNDNYQSVVLYGSVILALILAMGNKFWLKKENWLYSDNVESALTIDPDNEASTYWHGDGKREARTLLHQIGHDVSEADLDGMIMCVFSLGYWAEYERKTALKNSIAELEAIIEDNQEAVAKAEAILEEYENRDESEKFYELQYSQMMKKYNRLKEEYEKTTALIREKDAEIERLTDLLEEENSAAQVPTDREELKIFILNQVDQGKSYSQIGAAIGKSKGFVAKIVKESRDQEEEQNTKIVSIKAAMG